MEPVIALLMIVWANGSPVLAGLLLGDRWSQPVDAGARFLDGRPWLGPSKTWRGVMVSAATTPLVGLAVGVGGLSGLAVAAGAMTGDSLASFLKRRLGLPSSRSALLLDQVPESLLPALMLRESLRLDGADLVLVVGGFLLIDLALTPLAQRLRVALHHTDR